MKKIIAIVLAAAMMCTFAACGEKTAEYKLGMGVELSTASSKENNAQVDATVAAVVLDASGKIVQCRIDVAQNKMDVTGGAVDTAKTFETKMELGSRYGMEGKVDNNGDGVMSELMQRCGLKHRPSFLQNYLQPAMGVGLVRMLHPEQPRHPRQRYMLSVRGLLLKNS